MLPSSQSTEPETDDEDIKELEVDQLAFQALLEENEISLIDYEMSVNIEEGGLEKILQDAPETYDPKYICRICLGPTTDTKCWKLFDKTMWSFCEELREKLDYVAGKINYKVTLNPVVCKRCTESIYTAYDFKKQVEAVEDRILEKIVKGSADCVVDLRSLLDENANKGCKEDSFKCDENRDGYQSVESAEDTESNQSKNEMGDVGGCEVNQGTQDVDRIECDILGEKKQLSTDESSRVRRREYPRTFDLFDEEHDRYFEKYKDGPECKLSMKWASFAKRPPQFGTGSFLCPECGVTFRTKPLYIKHLKEHKGEHLVVCAYCGKLVKQHRLRYHITVSHQPRKQECQNCGKKFHTSQQLATHKRTMHAPEVEWHQCQICGKLLRKNSINGHVAAHNPTTTYACDICGTTFKARSYWVRHKKRHTSSDGIPCSYCGKPFKYRDYLSQHIKQVHEQTDYNCATCGKRLSNRDALRRHLRNVHAPNKMGRRSKRKPPDERKDENEHHTTGSDVNKVNVTKVRILKQDNNVIVYNKISDDDTESSTIILNKTN